MRINFLSMTHNPSRYNPPQQGEPLRLHNLPKILLAPVPLFLYQPFLDKVITHVIRNNSSVFNRLGSCINKTLIIEPTNLPFVLVLKPNPAHPSLHARRSKSGLTYDALISGTFLNLLRLVDGQLDGDSLFFTRDLVIRGDTEAIVSLRNALDNMEHSLADEIAGLLGPIGKIGMRALRHTSNKVIS